MPITIELPAEKEARLAEAARAEGIDPSTLLVRLADDFLDRKTAFEAAAKYVLHKNTELYRRLAQ